MKAKAIAALCAASLLAGLAAGFLLARGNLDAELEKAIAEKDRLISDMKAAAAAVGESGERLESINKKMAAATSEADRAAAEIGGKAATIEVLVNSLKAYAQDARGKLRELSKELGAAVDANKASLRRIDGLLEGAEAPGQR
jgi:hypothetical protein